MTQVQKADGYFHFRTGEKGGVTAGWRRNYENQTFVFAFAKVHGADLYNKKTGRNLVDERLFLDHPLSFTVDLEWFKDHLRAMLQHQDVVENTVVDAMLEEIQFADIKTKALVSVAENVASFVFQDNTGTKLKDVIRGSV